MELFNNGSGYLMPTESYDSHSGMAVNEVLLETLMVYVNPWMSQGMHRGRFKEFSCLNRPQLRQINNLPEVSLLGLKNKNKLF